MRAADTPPYLSGSFFAASMTSGIDVALTVATAAAAGHDAINEAGGATGGAALGGRPPAAVALATAALAAFFGTDFASCLADFGAIATGYNNY